MYLTKTQTLAFLLITVSFGACTRKPAAEAPAVYEPPVIEKGSALDGQVLRTFLALSDLAARALEPEPPDREASRKDPGMRSDYHMFFPDSYAVRALAVAYDLTGRQRYLHACRTWSDRMLRHQAGMQPAGAYYMNYGRKPGETEGEWFVADSGSIAMGVLATAARCNEVVDRERYIQSVKAYADLVLARYVRPSGGVTDGIWRKSDKEWWCSTAMFAAAAFELYNMTEEQKYKAAALKAVDWLLQFEYGDTILYKFEDGAPTTIFYILEAYSAALPHLTPGGARQCKVWERFSQTVEWIADNQTSAGTWDYSPDNWGVKLGGLTCHTLIYLDRVPDTQARERLLIGRDGHTISFSRYLTASARRALRYFATLDRSYETLIQRNTFTLMSFAEAVAPGELYQKRSLTFPYQRLSEKKLAARSAVQ